MKSKKRIKKQPLLSWSSVFDTPVGKIGVAIENNRIIRTGFLSLEIPLCSPKNQYIQDIVQSIKNYFIDPGFQLDLPIFLNGTVLQEKIWRALQKIPLGQVVTYGELAKKLNTGPRVVGNACALNPLPIVIPCHRVVSGNGIGGYCGTLNSVEVKRWLLNHENKNPRI